MRLANFTRDDLLRTLAAIDAAAIGPRPEDLANAPRLDLWFPLVTPAGAVFLVGKVTGHPRLGPGWIHTSNLVAVNVASGWARTISRWYILRSFFSSPLADGSDPGDEPGQVPSILMHAQGGAATEETDLETLVARYVQKMRAQATDDDWRSLQTRGEH
jgi:hypothetical protein